MNHAFLSNRTTTSVVSAVPSDDVMQFVSDCMRQKRLSSIMKDLNRDLLFGTPQERQDAREALKKLGFL